MPLEQTFFIAVIFILLALAMMVIVRYLWTCLRHNGEAHTNGANVEPSWFGTLVGR